jgi:predicted DNA repair protein MutK
VIRVLGVVGTLAMLLVGGGMFTHNVEMVHHLYQFLPTLAADLLTGLAVGGVVLALQLAWKKMK